MRTHPEHFWLGLLAALVIVLWLVRAILLPFVLGMAVGYLLHPLVDRLERRGISRAAAAGVMVATTYGVAIFGILLLAPLLARQIINPGDQPAGLWAHGLREALAPVAPPADNVRDLARSRPRHDHSPAGHRISRLDRQPPHRPWPSADQSRPLARDHAAGRLLPAA